MSITLVSNQDWNYSGNENTGFNGSANDVFYNNQTDTIIFSCTGNISYSYSAVMEYSGGIHHDALEVYEDNVLVDTVGANSPPSETGSRTWAVGSTAKQLKFVMRTDGGLTVTDASALFYDLKIDTSGGGSGGGGSDPPTQYTDGESNAHAHLKPLHIFRRQRDWF